MSEIDSDGATEALIGTLNTDSVPEQQAVKELLARHERIASIASRLANLAQLLDELRLRPGRGHAIRYEYSVEAPRLELQDTALLTELQGSEVQGFSRAADVLLPGHPDITHDYVSIPPNSRNAIEQTGCFIDCRMTCIHDLAGGEEDGVFALRTVLDGSVGSLARVVLANRVRRQHRRFRDYVDKHNEAALRRQGYGWMQRKERQRRMAAAVIIDGSTRMLDPVGLAQEKWFLAAESLGEVSEN